MWRRYLRVVLVVAVAAVATTAWAADTATVEAEPTDLKLLIDTIRSNRKALVQVNLQLTEEESAKFWPLYDRYWQELSAIGDRVAALLDQYIQNFRVLSNEQALQLINDYLNAEAERIKVRQTYLPEFAKILPGRTVARFYQLENKFDALMRYEIASVIPVIDEKAQ